MSRTASFPWATVISCTGCCNSLLTGIFVSIFPLELIFHTAVKVIFQKCKLGKALQWFLIKVPTPYPCRLDPAIMISLPYSDSISYHAPTYVSYPGDANLHEVSLTCHDPSTLGHVFHSAFIWPSPYYIKPLLKYHVLRQTSDLPTNHYFQLIPLYFLTLILFVHITVHVNTWTHMFIYLFIVSFPIVVP